MMRTLVIVFALLAGAGAGGLGYISSLRPEPMAAAMIIETPMAEVLAPQSDILRGGRLGEDMLSWTEWPEDRLRAGMILRRDDPDAETRLVGRRLRSNVYAGEPLRRAHLAEGEGGYLALALQPRMRAVGVPVTASKTAGGFIMPNDRVDVLLTVIRDLDGDGAASGATRTILTNVRVLAIGEATLEEETAVRNPSKDSAAAEGGKPPNLVGKTATLEVAPDQAEILLAAAASGTLSLALRASEDFGLSGIGDVDMVERPRAADGPSGPLGAPAQAMSAPRREITIISGGQARRIASQSGGPGDG